MAARKKREAHKVEKPASNADGAVSTPNVADVKADLADAKSNVADANAAPAKQDLISVEPKEEVKPIIISDAVTESAERIKVIEDVTPEPKSETETPAEPASPGSPSVASPDPLADFKEKMSEEEALPVSSPPPQKNFMWPILFVFIVAILILGGIFIYKKGIITSSGKVKVNVVTLTPAPTVAPSPTIAVDLTKYEIKVLNGSEVEGEAGRQRTNLEAEGFIVSSVGNADSSDYSDTIIQAKEEVEAGFLDKLKSVLETTFTLAETEVLSEDATTPIVVILGTKK